MRNPDKITLLDPLSTIDFDQWSMVTDMGYCREL
jgi:hypothetical protein